MGPLFPKQTITLLSLHFSRWFFWPGMVFHPYPTHPSSHPDPSHSSTANSHLLFETRSDILASSSRSFLRVWTYLPPGTHLVEQWSRCRTCFISLRRGPEDKSSPDKHAPPPSRALPPHPRMTMIRWGHRGDDHSWCHQGHQRYSPKYSVCKDTFVVWSIYSFTHIPLALSWANKSWESVIQPPLSAALEANKHDPKSHDASSLFREPDISSEPQTLGTHRVLECPSFSHSFHLSAT